MALEDKQEVSTRLLVSRNSMEMGKIAYQKHNHSESKLYSHYLEATHLPHEQLPHLSQSNYLSTPSLELNKAALNNWDRGHTSCRIALVGLFVTIIFSILCIATGIFIALQQQYVGDVFLPPILRARAVRYIRPGIIGIFPNQSSVGVEILGLTLNIMVTFCTETTGFVHSVAQRSALAAESRLLFNTNLRLITAARHERWTSPNGTLFNIIMSILLMLSYLASSLIFTPVTSPMTINNTDAWWQSTCVMHAPVILLGVVLLLQTFIALMAIRSTRILTWSSSAFDIVPALLHEGQLRHVSHRCMHSVSASQLDSSPNYHLTYNLLHGNPTLLALKR